MAVFFNLVGGKARTVFVSGGIRQEAWLPVSARLEPGLHLLTTPGIRPGNAKGGHRITGGRLLLSQRAWRYCQAEWRLDAVVELELNRLDWGVLLNVETLDFARV
ncbi:hypothetical protein ASF64_17665 [Arthrobacter sp. Leaf137]|nr:hypothetical protein ASF64_17665 [Arthrobacter sp. Leaf137]